MVAIKTTGLTVGEALRLLNSCPTQPNATTDKRLVRYKKRFELETLSVPHILKHTVRRLYETEQAGPQDRAAKERERATKERTDKRDIGELPTPEDPELRAECDASLFTFATTCFPELFYLEHSPDHYTLSDAIQETIEQGGKKAIACQRGFGKTVWCVLGVMWAALTARVPMIMLISGNDLEASNIAAGIITELETNDHLAAVYPEICHAYRFAANLGPTARPLYKGESVRMKAKPDIVFPALPGVVGAECCIRVCGIDSRRIRGAHHKTTTGKHVRPGVVLLDDPQDDDIARRPKDIDKREAKIKKAIHGVAGPGRRVSVLMPCTVIEKNDLADRFLNPNLTPEYHGMRFPALDKFPTIFADENDDSWNQYFELLKADLLSGDEQHAAATEYYEKHKKRMTKGAVVRWAARVEGYCVDALQTLMNKYAEDRAAFMSEFQQAPENDEDENSYLDETELAARFNNMKRRTVPADAVVAVAGIDVQQRILYWNVICWSEDLKGYICDYGTFPKQRSPQFTHLNAPYTFEDFARKQYPLQRLKWEESLKLAVRTCVEQNIMPAIKRTGGESLVVTNAHIDSQWQKSTKAINEVAAELEFKDVLQPDGGVPIGPNDTPVSQRKMPKGSRRPSRDVEWYFKQQPGAPDKVMHDANYYRSQFQQGLAAEPGTPGSVTFFGSYPNTELADHYSAKWVERKEGKRQTCEVWKNKVGRDQDHWLDCGVMARVAVEVLGFRNTGSKRHNAKAKKEAKKLDPAKLAAAKQRAARRY